MIWSADGGVERDFGYSWTQEGSFPVYRVSWKEQNGELYAMNCSTHKTETLGFVDKQRLDSLMAEWPDKMHVEGSLKALRAEVAMDHVEMSERLGLKR